MNEWKQPQYNWFVYPILQILRIRTYLCLIFYQTVCINNKVCRTQIIGLLQRLMSSLFQLRCWLFALLPEATYIFILFHLCYQYSINNLYNLGFVGKTNLWYFTNYFIFLHGEKYLFICSRLIFIICVTCISKKLRKRSFECAILYN